MSRAAQPVDRLESNGAKRAALARIGVAGAPVAKSGASPQVTPLALGADDVIPTGNEIVSFPAIRAADGAIPSFNVLSMRHRGLLEVSGGKETPALRPFVAVNGNELVPAELRWELTAYWIPTATFVRDGIRVTYTYCAPPDERGAMIRVRVTNERADAAPVRLGMEAQWADLNRVQYAPVPLPGEKAVHPFDPKSDHAWFSYGGADNDAFAFTFLHPGATQVQVAPSEPGAVARRAVRDQMLEPGASAEAVFVIGIGVDRLSSQSAASTIEQRIRRGGSDSVVSDTAAWARARTRTTGQPDLDVLMNRNYLFTRLFAWGRTFDTDQLVGVTSRSPRYYVSAAYWDRDSMLWSLPALIDTDPRAAREALEYALTVQLNNTGTHSRFIDGVVLESGFQLDEAAAPLVGLARYVRRTGDFELLRKHREAVGVLAQRLYARRDAATGLYASHKDSQDEFQREPFMTYPNVLAWRAMGDLRTMFTQLGDTAAAAEAKSRAGALKPAILKHLVADGAPGAGGPIFAVRSDGQTPVFAEVPPGALLLLPALGFCSENDPLFVRTYDWLHSANHKYAYADEPYGLPGSYRVPFTTSWSVADHLLLSRGRERALRILRASPWDGGIVTEGIDPHTAKPDIAGRAFATAAGYVAHAICESGCTDETAAKR